MLNKKIIQFYRHFRLPKLGFIGKNINIGKGITFSGFFKNIKIGTSASIGNYATITCTDKKSILEIGDNTVIKAYAMLMTHASGLIKIGNNCSINPFCVLYGHGGLVIGDNVRIATHCVFIPANHNFGDLDKTITEQGLSKLGIKIGSNVWIGANVTVLDGCEIGDGAVVGAGAVVTGNVAANSVVAGVPARLLRYRNDVID